MRGTTILIAVIVLHVGPSSVVAKSDLYDSLVSDVTTQAKPWTSLEINNASGVFRFAVVTDHTGGPREGIFAEAVQKLNLMQPEFVMSIGDLIEGYEDARDRIGAQWDKFQAIVAGFEIPFFYVPGNHDNGRPMWSEVYRERFGVEYYHFVYKNVLFLCLSTNDGPNNNTGVGQEQAYYVAQVLRKHPDVRWTFVVQHKPLWNDSGDTGWKKIESLLKGRRCTVFAGHTHDYLSQEKEGISFITLATTGGGSALRGAAYGEFDQVAWVTMTDHGPKIANLLLDGIFDRNVRTPETAEELALFRADKAVTATPILLGGDQFSSGTSTLTITNPSPHPLRVKILTEAQVRFTVDPVSIATVIPGRSESITKIHVVSKNPLPIGQVQPLVLHWTGYYDRGNNTRAIKVGGERRILVDAPFHISKLGRPVRVDGNLDEWSELSIKVHQPGEIRQNVTAWKGPQDGSLEFSVAFDSEYLYVAAKASDNERCFDGWKYWEDFVVLWVDGRASEADDAKKSVFSVVCGPQVSEDQSEEFAYGESPQGVKTAGRATDSGFEAEFAIPASYLNERQGGNWRRVRLNVGFSDFDRSDAREGLTILYWRPQWDNPHSYPESGVFVRSE